MDICQLRNEMVKWMHPIETVMAKYSNSKKTFCEDNKIRRYWHIKNGSCADILLVAHSDTVQEPKINAVIEDRLYAAGLDDRLGMMLAFNIAKSRNGCDILITDEEECGKSTAELVPEKDLEQYRLIIELDREGNDVVDYDLADKRLLKKIDRHVGIGSFSDICSLKNPKCSCINMGIGYYDAHSKFSYCELKEVNLAIKDINWLIEDTKGESYPAPEVDYYDYMDDNFYYEDPKYWMLIAEIECEKYNTTPSDLCINEEDAKIAIQAGIDASEYVEILVEKYQL